jgi:hypothetical protein
VAYLGDRIGEWHQLDGRRAQRRHGPPPALVDGVDRGQAETGGQDAVERSRRPPALDVAEHGGAGLVTGPLFYLSLQRVADAAQPRMAELVE